MYSEQRLFKERASRENLGVLVLGSVRKNKVGKYRHYKGNEYEVLYIAKHSETLEDMVVYRALYGDFGVWVRPASMWNEIVEVNGNKLKRFEFIG